MVLPSEEGVPHHVSFHVSSIFVQGPARGNSVQGSRACLRACKPSPTVSSLPAAAVEEAFWHLLFEPLLLLRRFPLLNKGGGGKCCSLVRPTKGEGGGIF